MGKLSHTTAEVMRKYDAGYPSLDEVTTEEKASGGCGDDLGCGGPHTNGHSAGKFSSPVELEEFMDASLIALEQLHKDEGAANA
jgi:hypothetical protein